jgi:hypothetical protein
VFDFRSRGNEIRLTLAPVVGIQGTLREEDERPRGEGPAIARINDDAFLVQLSRPGGSAGQESVSAQWALMAVSPCHKWRLAIGNYLLLPCSNIVVKRSNERQRHGEIIVEVHISRKGGSGQVGGRIVRPWFCKKEP